MKLSQILEDFSNWRDGMNLNRTASGGQIKASGLWGFNSTLWKDSFQKKDDTNFLKKVRATREKGYEPEELSYEERNRIQNMVDLGIVAFQDGKYYITTDGEKFLDSFITPKQTDWVKSYTPMGGAGGITGIGQN